MRIQTATALLCGFLVVAIGSTPASVAQIDDSGAAVEARVIDVEALIRGAMEDREGSIAKVLAGGYDIKALGAGDFDSDGRLDLAIVGWSGSGQTGRVVLISDIGALAEEVSSQSSVTLVELDTAPTLAAVGDFDADGHLDLALAEAGGSVLRLLSGNGSGGFQLTEVVGVSGRIQSLSAGEINRRDGLADLVAVTAVQSGWELLVFEGPEGALTRSPEVISLPAEEPRDVLFGHFDDDRWRDIAVSCGGKTVLVHGRDRMLSYEPGPTARIESPRLEIVEGDLSVISSAERPQGSARELPAVLSARVNGDAIDDYVIARAGEVNPTLLLSAPSTTFTVDSTGDGGDANTGDGNCDDGGGNCTLRAAIEQANASAGADLIDFNVGGGGAQTITVASVLPTITGAVEIDGTSQPGFAGTPLIWLAGGGLGGNGLTIVAGSSAVKALAVGGFGGSGIVLSTGGGNIISGCHIGTDLGGTTDNGNGQSGVLIQNSSGNTIGGTAPGSRNVISGNGDHGVHVDGASATLNDVQGNYIGVDAQGDDALANDDHGVFLNGPNNTVGGTESGAGNVISGNGMDGVKIAEAGNMIQSNRIGTNAGGADAIGNTDDGVDLESASGCTIGGTVSGARNLISGNDEDGIFVQGGSSGILVQGNYVGTDVTGTSAVPNGIPADFGDGVEIVGSDNNTIGGTVAGARNVISGNDKEGVYIHNGSEGNLVQGNYVGTNAAGTAAIGNADDGIDIRETSGNTVGGSATGAGNVLSGNGGDGIEVAGAGAELISMQCPDLIPGASGSTGNVIQGNAIGTSADRLAAIPNAGNGIEIEWADETLVGGAAITAANLVSGNSAEGVEVYCGSEDTVVQNNTITANGAEGVAIWDRAFDTTVSQNRIFSNGGLGIDLDNPGVTANDPGDPDTGPNGLQNFPVLTSVSSGSTVVDGALDSTPSTTFDVEIFSVASCDVSGNGEGEVFLGEFQVTTAATGIGAFSETLVPSVTSGHVVTATATDPAGNTSEFSACTTPTTCADGAVENLTVTDTQLREACGTLTVGPAVTVEGPNGDLTLRGGSVVIKEGFSVLVGGEATVELSP